jgi:hypothetical protein
MCSNFRINSNEVEIVALLVPDDSIVPGRTKSGIR